MAGKRATAMDYEAMTSTMEADPLEDSQIDKARRVIAGHPDVDAAAAAELMKMLGIFPGQEADVMAPVTMPAHIND